MQGMADRFVLSAAQVAYNPLYILEGINRAVVANPNYPLLPDPTTLRLLDIQIWDGSVPATGPLGQLKQGYLVEAFVCVNSDDPVLVFAKCIQGSGSHLFWAGFAWGSHGWGLRVRGGGLVANDIIVIKWVRE